jgi:DNA ligase (NAD+)
LTIDYEGCLEIRGEGLIPFKDFERINNELISKGEEPYSSHRNLAAGSVRQLDANITKNRNLIFIAFGIVKCNKEFTRKNVQFAFLQELGFEVVEGIVVNKDNIVEYIEWFKNKLQYLDYLTDGLIVEYDNINYGKAQGFTGHHNKALYALKWQDDNCETTFQGVELNTTRTGMTSITGLFHEVNVGGVKVSRASLHNYDIFQSLQLGIGDIITVYRANQVIPQIEDNLTRSNTYKIDMHCPSCGSDLVIKQPKEARFLFCENENCPARMVDKFVHFCSKDAMNIDGLSEATLEKFINKGFIKTFSDIYKLEQYKSQIINLDGFGVKSYNKLIEAIEKSKNTKFENFIYALGIDQIGKGSSKRLAKHFDNDINKFLDSRNSYYDLLSVEDFGDITVQAVMNYFQNEGNMNEVDKLLDFHITIDKPEVKSNNTNKDLTGKTFVVTGSITTYKNRNELEDLIISLNGKLAGSVSKNTTYLINNDITSTSGKNQKANELGVPIISEVEFNKMIGREV